MPDYEISPKGVKFITQFEGFSAEPFWDVNRYSHGYGTISAANAPPITKDAARDELKKAVEKVIIPAIPKKAKLKQQELDALASFGYNLGPKPLVDTSYSTLARRLRSQEGAQFQDRKRIYKDEFPKWRMPGSKFEAGLLKRRKAEIEMAINGDYG